MSKFSDGRECPCAAVREFSINDAVFFCVDCRETARENGIEVDFWYDEKSNQKKKETDE
jgi:hypothetical protein